MGTTRWLKYKVETLPVPQISAAKLTEIEQIAEDALQGISIDKELNKIFYDILGLSESEINTIEY